MQYLLSTFIAIQNHFEIVASFVTFFFFVLIRIFLMKLVPSRYKLSIFHEYILPIMCVAAIAVGLSLMFLPFQSYVVRPEEVVEIRRDHKPRALIVLIHGWQGNDQSWESYKTILREDRNLNGVEIIAVNYITLFAQDYPSIASTANRIHALIRKGAGSRNVFIIAHSLGGVISRYIAVLNELSKSSEKIQIEGIATYGSPFKAGNNIASLATQLRISRSALSDLTNRSTFLSSLDLLWGEVRFKFPKNRNLGFCIHSTGDNIVKRESALLSCSRTFEIAGFSHVQMVSPDSIYDPRYLFYNSNVFDPPLSFLE